MYKVKDENLLLTRDAELPLASDSQHIFLNYWGGNPQNRTMNCATLLLEYRKR